MATFANAWPGGPDTDDVLRKGLLPDNLPPFLSSASIADRYLFDTEYQIDAKAVGRPSHINGSKRGFQRRIFSLPHPAFVRDAALFFEKHWDDLKVHLTKLEGSASIPQFGPDTVRSMRFTPHARLPLLRLRTLSRYRYCVVTDVSRCYPSIYTHSLPWAIHGREASKKDRKPYSKAVFGNRLDFILRQSQDGQTVGIPVGPDTSRIAAELVLAAVDQHYAGAGRLEGYLRHVDDFWIGGNSIQDCEDRLHRLRQSLNYFSLDANEQKTRIVATSAVISETWPYDLESQLEQALMPDKSERHEGRLVSLLGSLIEYSTKSQDEGIIRFFLRKIDSWRRWDEHWDVLEPFLSHCGVQFPHAFDYVARIVAWRARRDQEIDQKLWRSVNKGLIRVAAPLGRDSEVIWGLWLSKEIGQKISAETYSAIADNNGALVVGVLAHFAAHGRTSSSHSLSELWDRVEDDGVCGSEWPLALELNHLGAARPDRVEMSDHPALRDIFDAKLSLVKWDAPPAVFLGENDEIDPDPASALEEMGWGYDDDDDDEDDEGDGIEIEPDF